MQKFDVSPEAQRLLINLMLAALRSLNNKGLPEPGQPGAEVEDFDVNPELQRQFINTIQAFAAGIRLPGPSGPPLPECKGLLQALEQEIRALGGIPVNTVPGWRERFASCRGKIPASEYNEGMSLLEPQNR